MYFVLKETKYNYSSDDFSIVDSERYKDKKTALKIAESLQTIAIAKNKNDVFYCVLSQDEKK
jgi:hypothetical protein|tara:strand:- start:170 stop:355 length:186 start_codon:yes stop_codon:yes gene_type:complete